MTSSTVKLGDVVAINPRFEKANGFNDDTSVCFVPMAAVDETQGLIREIEHKRYSSVSKGFTNFRRDDVLFAKITPCMQNGKAALFDCGDIGFGSTEFFVLRASDRILPRFIYHLVRQETFRSEAKANFTGTAGQQRVPRKFLEDYQIELPSLPEQQRIVDILDRAASIQRLRKAADEKLKELIPALFIDMFGDPASNPKGWPTRRFDQIGKVQLGRQRAPKYQTGAYRRPYMRVANVYEDHIDLSDVLTMDFDERDFSAYRLVENDILINEGQSIELVGRPAIWRGEIADCCFQNTLVRFQADGVNVLPYYAYWLVMHYYRGGVLRSISSKTSNVAHMGAGRFAALQAPCPPMELQRRFSKIVGELEATREANVKALDVASAVGPAIAELSFS